MRRMALVLALTAGLSLSLALGGHDTWAEPVGDGLHQTVPTRTPTSPPRTPEPVTPAREPAQNTPTWPVPTGTAQASPTGSIAPTMESSPTASPGEAIAATAVTTRSPEGGEWDFGDAPDPAFASLLVSGGARHSITSFEWLGEGADTETDSRQVDEDLYDDGVVPGDVIACAQGSIEVTVTVKSRDDPQHPYDAQHFLYLNLLVDWDGDGSWSGRVDCPDGSTASEWAVRNLPVDVSTWPAEVLAQPVSVQLSVGPRAGQTWARFSLSYDEVISGTDWDGTGVFMYGETEDHLLTVSAPGPSSPETATASGTGARTPVATGGPDAGGRPWTPTQCFGGGLAIAGLLVPLTLLALKRKS
jgi:hypothetical protein